MQTESRETCLYSLVILLFVVNFCVVQGHTKKCELISAYSAIGLYHALQGAQYGQYGRAV